MISSAKHFVADKRRPQEFEAVEEECVMAYREKLRKAVKDFSRRDLATRARALTFQVSILYGFYVYDTWETIFSLAIYTLLLAILVIGWPNHF